MGRNDSVEKIIKRGIVTLDNSLPEDLGLFWLTAQEIHDRLVNKIDAQKWKGTAK